jgi:hypothetical protein
VQSPGLFQPVDAAVAVLVFSHEFLPWMYYTYYKIHDGPRIEFLVERYSRFRIPKNDTLLHIYPLRRLAIL